MVLVHSIHVQCNKSQKKYNKAPVPVWAERGPAQPQLVLYNFHRLRECTPNIYVNTYLQLVKKEHFSRSKIDKLEHFKENLSNPKKMFLSNIFGVSTIVLINELILCPFTYEMTNLGPSVTYQYFRSLCDILIYNPYTQTSHPFIKLISVFSCVSSSITLNFTNRVTDLQTYRLTDT